MNRQTAHSVLGALHHGNFEGAEWFGADEAVATFVVGYANRAVGYANRSVADFGRPPCPNSGRPILERVTVDDKQALRAIRRLQRPD